MAYSKTSTAKRVAATKARKGRAALPAHRAAAPRPKPLAQGDDRAELCSTLSHDLRNPLTVIVWSSQILGRRLPTGDASRHHLDAITRAAEELNSMLHDLSDAARIADGRLPNALVLEPCDVAALVEQAVAPSRSLVASKELALTVEVSPELGPMSWDRERLGRLLVSLIANAARRTPKAGRIAVHAEPEATVRGARIVVEDTAPDIPEHDRGALFQLPAAPPPGTPRRPRALSPAIGLFVARGVVEAHGGKMWIEGDAGKGSRFVITLPAGPAAPA